MTPESKVPEVQAGVLLDRMPTTQLRDLLKKRRRSLLEAMARAASRGGEGAQADHIDAWLESDEEIDTSVVHALLSDTEVKRMWSMYSPIWEVMEDRMLEEEVQDQQRRQKRRGLIVLGAIAGFFLAVFTYFQFKEDPYTGKINRQRVAELKSYTDFHKLASYTMPELAESMAPRPPRFIPLPSSFAELRQAPAGTLSSSQLHLWLSEGPNEQVQHLAVTGQADERTSRRVHSLLMTMMASAKNTNLSRFVTKNFIASHQSQMSTATHPRWAFFRREVMGLAQRSGQIRLHRQPVTLLQQAKASIQTMLKAGKPGRLDFSALLKQHKTTQALLFVPVRLKGSHRDLEIRLPYRPWSKALQASKALAQFEKSALRAMLGDTQRLKGLYQESLSTAQAQAKRCKKMLAQSSPALAQRIRIHRVCGKDGNCRIALKAREISYADFCRTIVPSNIRIVTRWRKEVEGVWQSLTGDAEAKRLRAVLTQTLWDALLRGRDLPLGGFQPGFISWRSEQRKKLWLSLFRAFVKLGVAPDQLKHAPLLFRCKVEGDTFVIRPVWRIELSNTVVVLDAKSVWPRVEHRWQHRKLAPWTTALAVTPPRVPPPYRTKFPSQSPPVGRTALKPAGSGEPLAKASERLALADVSKLKTWRAQGRLWQEFQTFWRRQYPKRGLLPALPQKVREILQMREALQEFMEVSPTNLKQGKLFELLGDMQFLVRKYHRLPPELYWKFVVFLAQPLARVCRRQLKREVSIWEFVEAAQRYHQGEVGARARMSPVMVQMLKHAEYKRKLGYEPAFLIARTMWRIRSVEPSFYAMLRRTCGRPKRGSRLLSEVQGYKPDSLLTLMAIDRWQARRALYGYEKLQAAAWLLRSNKDVRVGDMKRLIDGIEVVNREVLDVLHRFERVLGMLHATTAVASFTSRSEMAETMQRGADRILRTLQAKLTKYNLLLPQVPSFRMLMARMQYNAGAYRQIPATLLLRTIPVAYLHPKLQWQIIDAKTKGALTQVVATVEGDKLIVKAATAKSPLAHRMTFLGAPTALLRTLATQLNQAAAEKKFRWVDRFRRVYGDFSLYEQFLLLPVPQRAAMQAVSEALLQPTRARALVDTMIFRCEPPAGRDIAHEQRCPHSPVPPAKLRAGLHVTMPTLDALR